MKENKFVVIDIETLGTTPDSIIVDLSAVWFNPNERNDHQDLMNQSFNVKFSVSQQKKLGFNVSKGTLDWWKNQDKKAQKMIMPAKYDHKISEGFDAFKLWCTENGIYRKKDVQWFSRGGTVFDFPIIENKFVYITNQEVYNDYTPWFFWTVNDVRTVIRTATLDFSKTELDVSDALDMESITLHNSIDDCILEAAQLQLVFNA